MLLLAFLGANGTVKSLNTGWWALSWKNLQKNLSSPTQPGCTHSRCYGPMCAWLCLVMPDFTSLAGLELQWFLWTSLDQAGP